MIINGLFIIVKMINKNYFARYVWNLEKIMILLKEKNHHSKKILYQNMMALEKLKLRKEVEYIRMQSIKWKTLLIQKPFNNYKPRMIP